MCELDQSLSWIQMSALGFIAPLGICAIAIMYYVLYQFVKDILEYHGGR